MVVAMQKKRMPSPPAWPCLVSTADSSRPRILLSSRRESAPAEHQRRPVDPAFVGCHRPRSARPRFGAKPAAARPVGLRLAERSRLRSASARRGGWSAKQPLRGGLPAKEFLKKQYSGLIQVNPTINQITNHALPATLQPGTIQTSPLELTPITPKHPQRK